MVIESRQMQNKYGRTQARTQQKHTVPFLFSEPAAVAGGGRRLGPDSGIGMRKTRRGGDRQDRAEARQRQGRKGKGMDDGSRGVQKSAGRMVMYSLSTRWC